MNSTEQKAVRDLLDADLRRLDMTQKELAERLGITQGAIGNWVAKDAVPGSHLDRLLEVLGEDSLIVSEARRRMGAALGQARRAIRDYISYSAVGQEPETLAMPPAPNLRAHTEEAEFIAALPPHLQQYAVGARSSPEMAWPGGRVVRPDYSSPNVVADISSVMTPVNTMNRLTNATFMLALERRREEMRGAPPRTYVQLVVTPPTVSAEGSQRLALRRATVDADLFGVMLVEVPTPAAAAQVIAELEGPAKGA